MRIPKSVPDLLPIQNRKPIAVVADGQKILAFEGELVSTVLLAQGILIFSRKHTTNRPSGVYCGMGVCYECLVTINGVPNLRACQTYVTDQKVIETMGKVQP